MAVLLSSCATVPVKDEIGYGNEGKLGALEFHTLTPTTKHLSYAEWTQILLSQPLVCVSTDAFGDIKKFYEQVCSICGICDYDTTAAVDSLLTHVQMTKAGK